MNLERLNKIIDIYIDKFEMLTNDDCDENMKWRAMYHFKENFDLDAPDGRQRALSRRADALFTLCYPTPRDAGVLLRQGPVII